MTGKGSGNYAMEKRRGLFSKGYIPWNKGMTLSSNKNHKGFIKGRIPL